MTVQFTCRECGSGIHVFPSVSENRVSCEICSHEFVAAFNKDHEQSILKDCPCCSRKDFYSQRDFNRKIGVLLYLIPTAITIFSGLLIGIVSYFLFWLLDLFLYKKINSIAVCYKCNTIFRKVSNISEIEPFNHEMNDRIVYSDHDFKGQALKH